MKAGRAWALGLAVATALVWPMAAQQNSPPQTPPQSQSQDAAGQSDGPMTENPRYQQSVPASNPLPRSEAPPLSTNESSSEQTRIDLSPPKADELAHPDEGNSADDVTGVHEWNPLRAMKDVEVGDFYYRAGNYKAALSRFREALQYKPRDAVATFKLAQTLEKSKQFEEARAEYEAYLEILKDGPSAGEAKKALARLKKQ
ncbi:MAG: tetratricopeptide repeat protein [Candidatus Korobacteraceae bacterium]